MYDVCAVCCGRPLRSSAQPWGSEKSRVSMSFSDLACLETGNRIMRTVIKLARPTHGLSTSCAVSDANDAVLLVTNTCNSSGYDSDETGKQTRESAFWDPPSPHKCRQHAMIWQCNTKDDTLCCEESSLRRVESVASGLLCFPVAETLPRRDQRRVSCSLKIATK